MGFFVTSRDIGIDLGTSNTLVYVKGKGILLNEPSAAAIDNTNGKVLCVGLEAKNMIGRTPKNIDTIRPLRDGVIANFDVAQQMLKKFIKKVDGKGAFKNFKVVICHPSEITDVEKKSINQAVTEIGAHKIMTIEEPIAAAIGAGLPVDEPVGSMIIDIGGGTTEAAVVSLGGIVTSKSIRAAGDKLDETIINYIKRKFNVTIGERTAEDIKIQLGSAYKDSDEEETMEVMGSDSMAGFPKVITITGSEIREALKEPVSLIVEAIKTTLEQTPPELAADIMDKGIVLSGGGSLLKGLDKLIQSEIHIPTCIAENPLECVVLGAGKCLDIMDKVQ